MNKNQDISINRIIGLGLIIVGSIISFIILLRFYDQGFFDGKVHGIIYEYHIKIEEWIPSILYSFLIIISGIIIYKTGKLNNMLLFYTLIGIIIDRVFGVILFSNESLYGILIDIIIPIIIALTLISSIIKSREEGNRIKIKNYSSAILLGTLITIFSNVLLKGNY
jgi:hypothetical protein